MRRRLSVRPVVAFVALALVATSGVASAAPVGSLGTSALDREPAAALSPTVAGHKLTTRTADSRGPVDVGRLARQQPTKRPVGRLPNLGRGTPNQATAPSVGIQTLAPPSPIPATTNADGPAKLAGFPGLARSSGAATNDEPPDPWVAVGPDHVVQVVNVTMRITDRQGGGSLHVALPDFFGLPTNPVTFDSDGRVIYDSLHARWLATEVSWDCSPSSGAIFGNGYLDVAVSRTADPTGIWDVYSIRYSDRLPDFPAPGTSTDKVGFGSNMYAMAAGPDCLGAASFLSGHLSFVDWTDLTNGGSVTVAGTDLNIFSPRFAVQAPAISSRLFAISVGQGNLGTEVEYITLVGTVAGGTLAFERDDPLSTDGIVHTFSDPPAPQQPGPDTLTTAIDLRPTDAIWQNNRLAFVSTYPCGTGPRDCLRVTELNTSAGAAAAPSLRQDFLVAENGKDDYLGGIGFSGNGTLHVGWTRSSETAGDYPSSYTAHQVLGDALNSLSAKELLAAGTGQYTGNRWGDYLGVAQDPQVPSQAWDGNEFSGGGSEWKTAITPLRPAGTTYVPLAPARILDSRIGVGLSGAFTASIARTWQVTGRGGVPAGAVAVTGNVTVTGQEAGGYFSVTPSATNTPPSSTLNFPVGDTRANNLTVPLSAAGTLSAVFKAPAGTHAQLVFDVTGYFTAAATGATFHPLTPARVLDTRIGVGLAGTFVSGTPRTLVIAGTHGIPSGATAITGNLTVTAQTAGGYLSVTRVATASPPTSTLNFPAHDTRANGVFAPLDGAGAMASVFKSVAGARTQVVLDVTGYFVPGLGGLRFVPLNPSRIMDTRTTVLSGLHGVFHASIARLLPVDGHWGVPLGAAAVTGNLTVTGQTAGGYVAISPGLPPTPPPTSTLNFPPGDTRANGLVTPLNGTGDTYLVYVSLSGQTANLILDLSGYFK
jgi:hypothetical protein